MVAHDARGTAVFRTASTTMTSVVPSPSPSLLGQTVNFAATVASVPSGGSPTGAVYLLEGTATLGSCVLVSGQCAVSNANLAAGTHSLMVKYAGDAHYSPSATALSQVVRITSEPIVTLAPTSLTFGNQGVGARSPARTVTVTNTGIGNLSISSGTIAGTNPGDFAKITDTCSGTALLFNGTCTLSVTFTPTATGNRSALLSFTDNASDSPQTMVLTGIGTIPVPFINQPLVPTSAAPGGPGFTLTVNGNDFASDATVNWNGVALATSYVSSEELKATVPAANITSPGTASISVVNPDSALISNPIMFPVTLSVPTVNFSDASGSPIAVGAYPKPIGTGDFNGDGKLDLAVANYGSNNVTILLGNGNGTFTLTASPAAAGSGPDAIAVGDFNRDGKLDLAVANAYDNNVTILLGNGDGTFTPSASSPPTGANPYAMAVGDFNEDGKLDLAVVNLGGGNVTILLGNGNGTFAPSASSPAVGRQPLSIATGDFNRDGKLDLAVTNQLDNNVTILLGNGNGTFTPAAPLPTGPQPSAVAVGDFNGDGKAGPGGRQLPRRRDDPAGKRRRHIRGRALTPLRGTNPYAIAMGDFSADGKLDLAVVTPGTVNMTILLGNGDGTFRPTPSSPSTGSYPISIALGDFNGDGRLDLAVRQLFLEQRLSITPVASSFGSVGRRLPVQPDVRQPERGDDERIAAGHPEQHGHSAR